ncbi:MAG: DNA polymerase III subunit alpha [Candidatus Absconditabacterales bacterium]
MDLLEFEIRYRSFDGLSRKFNLGRTTEEICAMCQISSKGRLEKKLTDTDPNELKELTLETYSDYKLSFIEQQGTKTLGDYSLAEYVHRTEYELKVIKEMGFNSYLLVVADFINWAKNNQIPVGPGRGSAAGSLIAWLIGITDVNPLPFGLLFERFLNPARVSMPDIDTDFDDEQRERVFEYVRNHYGHENVAKIGTFMNMSAKAAFKDVARVMGIPFDVSNRISSYFTILNDDRTVNFRKCREEIDELRSMLESDEKLQEVVDITDDLIGTYRQTGVHACGIIIGPDDLTNYLPQQLAPNTTYSTNERNVTQYDYNAAKIEDTIGVIKMDFLGLSNLGIIKNTIKIIAKRYEATGKILPDVFTTYFKTSTFEPPIDDLNVYETIFQKGNTSGIFQFESEGMRKFLILLKPDRLDDVVSMSALYRPGPIEFIPSFIRRKQGEESIDYMYPELYQLIRDLYGEEVAEDEKRKLEEDLKPILENTYGVAVFQEQLMFMSQRVAGFSFAEADNLRRGIGKKIVELVKKMKIEFVEKAGVNRGYKPETAHWVFEKMIEPAALYSFNKSHSVAYSLVAFQTAYLKTYYPVEFHAALLRANETNTEELSKFINEIKFQGLSLLAPDVNISYNHVAALGNDIRLGFLCIKGVGSEVGETIQRERQNNGPYVDLADFLTRCQSVINRKSLEGLIKSGALDAFVDRSALLENIDHLLEWAKASSQISDGGLFGGGFGKKTLELKVKHPLSKMQILKLEHEVFKTFISFHPLDGLYPWVKSRGYNMISQFKNWNYDKEQKDFGPFTIVALVTKITRAKKKGFFIKVEDFSESIEFFVKEPLDIEDFDLLLISGYKGKGSARRKKLIKADLDRLIQVASAGGKYNPEETVFEVKKRRLGITSVVADAPKVSALSAESDGMTGDLGLEVVDTTALDTAQMDSKLLSAIGETGAPQDDAIDEIDGELLAENEEVLQQQTVSDGIDDAKDNEPSDEFSDDSHKSSEYQKYQDDTQKQRSLVHDTPLGSKGLSLPHDIPTIKKLQAIIKANPGDRVMELGSMKVIVSELGEQSIIDLLT